MALGYRKKIAFLRAVMAEHPSPPNKDLPSSSLDAPRACLEPLGVRQEVALPA